MPPAGAQLLLQASSAIDSPAPKTQVPSSSSLLGPRTCRHPRCGESASQRGACSPFGRNGRAIRGPPGQKSPSAAGVPASHRAGSGPRRHRCPANRWPTPGSRCPTHSLSAPAGGRKPHQDCGRPAGRPAISWCHAGWAKRAARPTVLSPRSVNGQMSHPASRGSRCRAAAAGRRRASTRASRKIAQIHNGHRDDPLTLASAGLSRSHPTVRSGCHRGRAITLGVSLIPRLAWFYVNAGHLIGVYPAAKVATLGRTAGRRPTGDGAHEASPSPRGRALPWGQARVE